MYYPSENKSETILGEGKDANQTSDAACSCGSDNSTICTLSNRSGKLDVAAYSNTHSERTLNHEYQTSWNCYIQLLIHVKHTSQI